jgi:hypothetical protein
MLKHIKNIESVTSLSKEKQQNLNAGSIFEEYECRGEKIIFNEENTCPPSHPQPHPTYGALVCCSGFWMTPEIVGPPL